MLVRKELILNIKSTVSNADLFLNSNKAQTINKEDLKSEEAQLIY